MVCCIHREDVGMLEKLLRNYRDFGLFLLRIVIAAVFMIHGYTKMFSGEGVDGVAKQFTELGIFFPSITAWLVAGGELICGVLLVFGLLTREAALYLICIMIGAIATVHGKNGFFMHNNGYEYNLVLIGACLCLLFSGGGMGSMDKVLFPKERWHFISDPSKIKLEPPDDIVF